MINLEYVSRYTMNLPFVNKEIWNVWNVKFLEERTAYEIIHILFSSQFLLIFAPIERWKTDDSVTTAISPYFPKTIDIIIHGDEFVHKFNTCTGGGMGIFNCDGAPTLLQILISSCGYSRFGDRSQNCPYFLEWKKHLLYI